MDRSKRKLRERQPKNPIKKRRVVKAKAVQKTEPKKVPLKTIFKKVKNGEDGSSIYMIKDANETPIENCPTDRQTDIAEKSVADCTSIATAICADTPDFTTKDIDALIECSDMATFLNFALDNNDVEETLALLNLHTPVGNTFTSTDNAAQPADTLQVPLDRSAQRINENSTLTSNAAPTTQLSNNEPPCVDPIVTPTIHLSDEHIVNMESTEFNGVHKVNMMDMDNHHEIPLECSSRTYDQKLRMSDSDCASTVTGSSLFDEITINERFSDRFPYGNVAVPPAKILEEILEPRALIPSYRLRSISESMFQCHVAVHGQNACGTGESKEHARNAAALSLLDKLVNTMFFGNVIGRLQELCAAINWPLPRYTDEMASRTQIKNEFVFVVACSVKQYREIGQGRSKKMAKIFAAYKMWHKLTRKS